MSRSPEPAQHTVARFLRVGTSSLLTLAVVLGAGGAAIVGSQTLGERAAAAPTPAPAPALQVEVVRLAAEEGYSLTSRFVGQVEARAESDLSFELAGQLTEILVDEGDPVSQGQVVARLDTSLLEAEAERLEASRSATRAQFALAEQRRDRARTLREKGFASKDALDAAEAAVEELAARLAELDASYRSVAVNLGKSELRAPYAGRVGVRPADPGETLAPGQPVLSLIEDAAPRVRVGLPVGLEPSVLETVEVELSTGRTPAHLVRVRPDVDPLTRTQTAIFALEDGIDALSGDTATLSLERFVETPGVWVPLGALTEATGGGWSVLLADEGVVRVARVEILHSDGERAFVRGTFPPDASMIPAGAHRFVPGQSVAVTGGEG